jgi:Ca2+-binding EF-hand superfamily protein
MEAKQHSRKSRSIMFNFKKCLKDNGLTLKDLCFNVFSFEKERFSRSEFTQLIREIDERLSYEDIDHLIENLDPDGSGFVLFGQFNKVLQDITEADDPFNNVLDVQSSKIVERSRISGKVSDPEKAILLLKDIKDRIKGSDPYQLLDLFDLNRDGMFDHHEFDEFAINYGVSQKGDRDLLRKHLYGKKEMLTYKEFIRKLELEGVPKRVRFEDLENL